MKSKSLFLTLLGLIVLVVLTISYGIKAYNSLVVLDEGVQTAWGQVENQYQRRADLIPNLVNTVKGYAAHEKETLQGVIEARAKATQTTIDPSSLSPEAMQEYMKAQGEVSQALSRLMVTVERYPELKANENFQMLQVQLEGTENRITVERLRFNETAKEYNTAIRRFPKSIVARMMDFEKKTYFEAQEGTEVAPIVEF